MADPQARFDELLRKLRQRRCRLTPQRLAVLRLLTTSKDHLSPAQVYDRLKDDFPTMSLATVYKTLDLLKDMGEVLELGFSSDDNRYDARCPFPHPHVICTRCHRIIDAEIHLSDRLIQEAAQLSGYQIVGHRFDLYGLCPECQHSG